MANNNHNRPEMEVMLTVWFAGILGGLVIKMAYPQAPYILVTMPLWLPFVVVCLYTVVGLICCVVDALYRGGGKDG